jgi:hypothetical protein
MCQDIPRQLAAMTMRSLALALTVLLPAAGNAAEHVPPADYPEAVSVQEAIASPPTIRTKVAVFGYPVCTEITQCRLLATPRHTYPRIEFNASRLEPADQERLIHCLEPGPKAPCSAVLYSVRSGGTMKPDRIWWRSAQ